MTKSGKAFSYIDLFSGCGGLSLGLEAAGGTLIVAVEKSPMAGETFYHNLISRISDTNDWANYLRKTIEEQTESGLVVNELKSLLDNQQSLSKLRSKNPDLVVGGPPCQGFSLAGRRNMSDLRNQLPWQFLEMVSETNPKMVVIENVVGMRHKFNELDDDVFLQLQIALSEIGRGYVVQPVEVNALHYGAPQHRPRLMIIGLRQDIAKKKKITTTGQLWRSGFVDEIGINQIPALAPRPNQLRNKSRTVGEAIGDLQTGKFRSSSSTGFLDELRLKFGALIDAQGATRNHIQRAHTEKTQLRFQLYQALKSLSIDPRILAIPDSRDAGEIQKLLKAHLANVSFPVKGVDGTILATNLNELIKLIASLKTKKHSQRVLDWNEPARTVVTVADDYVHPFEPRTFTVRELARFQGFPDSFEFRAKETTGGLNRRIDVPQYSQVGNAVSPLLAFAVGELVAATLA